MGCASDRYIDGLILSAATGQWRKVALIVGKVLMVCRNNAAETSEHAIADRIRALVDEGKLQAQGNLSRWRHSEVKLHDGAGPVP
jgi:hypothetical protein